ncbi:sulfatase family protein [Catelliglobosispora koreensis]|uniref:sulfatase family protein n=1 Tax=Catelliglobosispora koreensis TaxID=129052 RepID=UPI00036D2C67|nr:sulfatase-like hydrolase/transferase [Catelliglobosispora koreensis]
MRRPNIILIVSDDHGYADRGHLGIHADVRTPALDRLAAEGVSCDQAYVSAPICSPSRSGIITGRHQARWGVHWFDDAAFAPPDIPTLAEDLRAQGYDTAYLGKVHYGKDKPGDRACPNRHGFDESYYGLAALSMGRLNYMRRSKTAVSEYGDDAASRMGVQPFLEGDTEVDGEGFLTAELGDRARDFVGRKTAQQRPYFLMLAFNSVHNFCWQLPDEELEKRGLPKHPDWNPDVSDYVDWYDGAISPNLDNGRAYYLAQLELMDAEIGKLLSLLDKTGTAGETLVVYTTDNGGSTCNYGDNTPLRGTKYTLFDGGIRVPLIARWPGGRLPAGYTALTPASLLDLAPTLLAAAGAPSGDHDGHNLLPGWTSAGEDGGRVLHWDCGFQWAVREGDLKLLWVEPGSPYAEAIRQVEHTDPGSGIYLFDLAADPGEISNLAAQRPADVSRLTQLHEAWKASCG